MRPQTGPGWLWLGFLAFGVVAVGIVFIALAADEDERPRERRAAAVAVPELRALDYRLASGQVERLGLVADSYPVEDEAAAGTVVAQDPAAGTRLSRGERVRMNVSTGPGEVAPLAVPDVTGTPAPEARRLARDRGFTTRTLDREAPSAEDVGEVLVQEPAAGARVPALTQITLYVGRQASG